MKVDMDHAFQLQQLEEQIVGNVYFHLQQLEEQTFQLQQLEEQTFQLQQLEEQINKVLSDASQMTHNYLERKKMDQYFKDIIAKHTSGIMPNQPRLLDQSVKYKWFNEILQDVASGKIDAKIGIASVNHAESVGYILPSDRTEFVSKLYPYEKTKISRGHVILVGNETDYDAIRRMLGFAVVASRLNIPKYEEFMDLLDDPPDDLTLPELRWRVELWVADIVSTLYNLQIGWKDGYMVIDDGGFDGDDE